MKRGGAMPVQDDSWRTTSGASGTAPCLPWISVMREANWNSGRTRPNEVGLYMRLLPHPYGLTVVTDLWDGTRWASPLGKDVWCMQGLPWAPNTGTSRRDVSALLM